VYDLYNWIDETLLETSTLRTSLAQKVEMTMQAILTTVSKAYTLDPEGEH